MKVVTVYWELNLPFAEEAGFILEAIMSLSLCRFRNV